MNEESTRGEESKMQYDRGVIAGMTIGLTGAIGAAMHSCGIDGIPMLAGVMGKAFLPYLPHLERLDNNSMPRNIRKWVEILRDLATDVKERQEAAKPLVTEG